MGAPLTDLTYFLANAGFILDGGAGAADLASSYRLMLSPTSRGGAVARRCELRYAAALGVPPAAIAPLRVLTWMIHACSLARRTERAASGVEGGWTTQEAYLALWSEAVTALDVPPDP